MSFSKVLGYFNKSVGSLNWVGLTNMEVTTKSVCFFAEATRDKCPSWRAPIVGTNPIVCLFFLTESRRRRRSLLFLKINIVSCLSVAKWVKSSQIGANVSFCGKKSVPLHGFFLTKTQGLEMEKKRILFISQEMEPYTTGDAISTISNKLPLHLYDKNAELRLLMPRYGTVNERRHRLHEVVRLSGINIIIDESDHPLIIKVASLPSSRLQVYFLDNEDYFKRKFLYEDAEGKPFADNGERGVFFAKGALEIVKKFGWVPDIIHCHGWMSALVPFYLKTVYKDEPLFRDSKVVFSAYDSPAYEESFAENYKAKVAIDGLKEEDLGAFMEDGHFSLTKGSIQYSDAIIKSGTEFPDYIETQMAKLEKPFLEFTDVEGDYNEIVEFYNSLVEENEVV